MPGSTAPVSEPVVYVTPREPVAVPLPAVAVEPAPAPAPAPAALSIVDDLLPVLEVAPEEEPAPADANAVAAESISVEASNEQAEVDLAADPSDYSVAANQSIEIQASETLSHYADWLGVSSARLRQLNNLRANAPVVMGDRLVMDFAQVPVAEFELKRRQFHLQEQQDFFRQYRIRNVDQYKVAMNDNIANLARRKYSVPMWLLRQYNPNLNFRQIQIGQTVAFPVLEPVQLQGSSGG
jgi:membrane-bound lytic murein transglycosylase D